MVSLKMWAQALLLLVFCFGSSLALADRPPFPGYISDVQAEKNESFYEIFLFVTPPEKRSLRDQIFSPLTNEFRNRYQEVFGHLDTESIVYQPTRLSAIDVNIKVTDSNKAVADQEKRKAYAEYMTKRLMEYHVDNYFKTQPQMRTVYEVKEKLQNVKVEVAQGVKLNMQYNLAGNILDVIVDNPWLNTKLALEMNPKSFGPGKVQESRLWLSKSLTTKVSASANAALNEGLAVAYLSKRFVWNIGSYVGYSFYFKDQAGRIEESRYLVGLSHAY